MKTKNEQLVQRTLHASGVHIREGEGEQSRTIAGYAIIFGVQSVPLWSDEDCEAREVIAPESVTRELLDESDIKMTMFHDRQLILARSNKGKGTLSYSIDEKGVAFEFEAPHTADGDKALELVRRGDIAGCSFAFSTYYYDDQYVGRESVMEEGREMVTYTVKRILAVHDFTLAADPAYPDTSVEVRNLRDALAAEKSVEVADNSEKIKAQIREMRNAAKFDKSMFH
ncbi:MAG: HK97 family phage prohead protease [Muribaculaceae bacterium]|nr:HK97 family phage prohead protease [Muribaculaceae bacterium]